MEKLECPEWEKLYLGALVELGPQQLFGSHLRSWQFFHGCKNYKQFGWLSGDAGYRRCAKWPTLHEKLERTFSNHEERPDASESD